MGKEAAGNGVTKENVKIKKRVIVTDVQLDQSN